MAMLQFSLRVDGMSDDALVIESYKGQDNFSSVLDSNGSWCHGFRYHIKLASRRPDITAQDTVDKNAELIMYRDGEVVQRIHGIVRSFSVGSTGHHHTRYKLVLVPAIERLSLRHNSRIFQLKTSHDIISQLMVEMDIQDFAFATTGTPKQREFCMQYRETDLEFINRLAAEEGMVYHIEQSSGKHTIIFSDDSQTLPSLGKPIPYNAMAGGVSSIPFIDKFTKTTQFEVSEAHSGDSSFKKPQYSFSQQAIASDMDYQRDTYQHYDAPGRFKNDETGKVFNQLRLDSLRRHARTAHGQSDEPQLLSGKKFELSEHTDASFNREWLVVASMHKGEQPQALEESAGGKPTTYSNTFEVIPADKTWRLPQATRPRVDGPMTAYVVGPDGEEIFCDEYGRIKLHFPWDRESKFDEYSSCWIQVSQGWAGSQYGMIAVPRIGQEVIVSFLNSDPDQPIVTGRAFNAQNLPPYPLPDNKTKTVWRSQTHQGEGYNEISFEDQAENEKVYLRAQKDFSVDVLNSQDSNITYDRSTQIGNNDTLAIAKDRTVTVEGNQNHKTTGQHVTQIDSDMHAKVGGDAAQSVAGAIGISADGEVTIKSGTKLTLQVGGSFVVIESGGVFINGATIGLNSGGSPGGLPTPSSPAILETAAQEGSPFVADC